MAATQPSRLLTGTTERLDRFLADQLGLSRTQAARLVADKARDASTASRPAPPGCSPAASASTVDIPEHEPPRTLQPAAIPLTVVFEDEHLPSSTSRPASWCIRRRALGRHARQRAGGPRHDAGRRRARAARASCTGSIATPPGLMVVAKTDLAHRRLGAAIAARRVRRTYAALAWGHLDESPTVIEAPIARHPTRPQADGGDRADGRPARTDAYVVARFGVVRPAPAGAPHRPHPPDPGAPGAHRPPGRGRSGLCRRRQPADLRGRAPGRREALERATPRQALHAAALAFRHPASGAATRIPGRMARRSHALHSLQRVARNSLPTQTL